MKNILTMDLKDLFSGKFKAESSSVPNSHPINFARDWKIIVLIFIVGLISLSSFAWEIYLSDQIAGGYLISSEEPFSVSVKMIDEKRLKADLLILDTRQADYLKLKMSQTKISDPSL